jgi:hypothetical protein
MNANVLSPLDAAPIDEPRSNRRYFYVGIGLLLALIIFLGFARTYWVPMASGSLRQHPAIHVHAALFFAWTALFLTQAGFAASGRLTFHRQLGLFGIALAGAMVVSGLLATVVTMHAAIGTPREVIVRANTGLSIGAMLMFSTFMILAIANLATPGRHKRFIVLAMFSMLQAAIARVLMPFSAIDHPLRTLLGAIMVDVLLLTIIALDARRQGRLHPVYVCGFAFVVIVQIVRRAILDTPSWLAFTNWIASLAA